MGSANTMKKLLIYLALALITMPAAIAQQDALYSQYMFNAFTVNPAYAGSRQSLSLVALAREQWMGMDGAPSSQTISVHSPIQGRKFALGLNAINDVVGPTRNSGVFGTYAYHLQTSNGKLAFGLRGGIYQSVFGQDELRYKDEREVYTGSGTLRTIVPSFDFGAYYYGKKHYIGLSTTHLAEEKVDFGENWAQADLALNRHYMLSAGYAFKVSEIMYVKPSMLAKFVPGAPLNIDVNTSVLLYNTLWLGASYRHNNAVVLLTEFNITESIRCGYSYDIVINRLSRYNKGSHELFVGFDFNVNRSKSVPTRLL